MAIVPGQIMAVDSDDEGVEVEKRFGYLKHDMENLPEIIANLGEEFKNLQSKVGGLEDVNGRERYNGILSGLERALSEVRDFDDVRRKISALSPETTQDIEKKNSYKTDLIQAFNSQVHPVLSDFAEFTDLIEQEKAIDLMTRNRFESNLRKLSAFKQQINAKLAE